jgi:hypothetical protein
MTKEQIEQLAEDIYDHYPDFGNGERALMEKSDVLAALCEMFEAGAAAASPQKDEILRFAEFFWANIGHTCTNGFYYNQRGGQVTVQQMYESFCQNFSNQAPAPQADAEQKHADAIKHLYESEDRSIDNMIESAKRISASQRKEEALQEQILQSHLTCTCNETYKSRNMIDPSCVLCDYGEEIKLMMQEYASLRGKEEGERGDQRQQF